MHPALGLGLGDPLDPVDARFELEAGVGPFPLDGEGELFEAAQFGLIPGDHLDLPAHLFGVHPVHPPEAPGEEGRLFPAGAAADFDDDVFLVPGVAGQHQDADFLPEGFRPGVRFGGRMAEKVLHLRVLLPVQHLKRLGGFGAGGAEEGDLLIEGGEGGVFFHQGGNLRRVAVRGGEPGFQLLIVGGDLFQFVQIITSFLTTFPLFLRLFLDLASSLFGLLAGEHHLPAAALAAQFKVHPHPEDEEAVGAAGVVFLHDEDVSD